MAAGVAHKMPGEDVDGRRRKIYQIMMKLKQGKKKPSMCPSDSPNENGSEKPSFSRLINDSHDDEGTNIINGTFMTQLQKYIYGR